MRMCAPRRSNKMYAFVHIEKTAGSCLNTILRRSFGVRHCDIRLPLAKRKADHRDHKACVDAADLRRVKLLYRHLRGIAGHNVKPYADLHAECPGIQYITILREPQRRFRSHFLNRGDGNCREDFERWLAADWVRNWQTKMIAGEPDAQKAINVLSARFGFVGLTERFDESLILLGEWLREPGFRPVYRRVNQLSDKRRPRDLARDKTDMSYLDSDETQLRIREANSEDYKLYDFVTSTIYPRQVAAYRGDLAAAVQELQRKNQAAHSLAEPFWGSIVRNYVYKPLLHFHAL
jgi:Sulfotransferase family